MLPVLFFVLLLLAFICFVLSAWGLTPKLNPIALGLVFWVAVPLTQALHKLL